MKKVYRQGAVGALMDEYERAVQEIKDLIERTDEANFVKIFDPNAADEDCRSIQTIMSHVVFACCGYDNYIRKAFSIEEKSFERKLLSKSEVIEQLDAAVSDTAKTLAGKWLMTDEEMKAISIESRWGTIFDLEQMLEHAIVHILRHRRQVEKFLANGDSN